MKKETSCVTSNTLIRFAESRKLDVSKFLKDIPYSYSYLIDTHNWIAHAYTKIMYLRLAEMLNDPNATYEAAIFSKKLRTLGIVVKIGQLFTGPEMAYKRCKEISWKFNRIYNMEPIKVERNHATIIVQYLPSFEPTKLGCRYTEGILAVGPTHWLLPKAEIKELQCQAEGAESCVYDIRFQEKRGFLKNFYYLTFGKARKVQEALFELEDNYATMERQRDELIDLNTNLEQKVSDRTEQNKVLLQQLSDYEKLQFTQNLMAKARHELNNPLTGLSMALRRMESACQEYGVLADQGGEEGFDYDRMKNQWNNILRSIGEVYSIIGGLRPFADHFENYKMAVSNVLNGRGLDREALTSLEERLGMLKLEVIETQEKMEKSLTALGDFGDSIDKLEILHARLPTELREQISSGITTIKKEAESMDGVVRTLAEFAKAGKYLQGKDKIDLGEFLTQYESRQGFRENGIKYKVISEKQLYAKADPIQLHEVFSNLFENSKEANAKEVEVRVYEKELRSGVVFNEVSVKDDGKGFKQEDKENIFLPYSTTKEGKLSGIGLSIVKLIVSTNRGFVDCESKPGQGATFYVMLPKYEK